jgi:hypothetical protein
MKKKAPQLVLPTNSRLFFLYNNLGGDELLTVGMARNSQCFNKKRKVLVTSSILSGDFCEVGSIFYECVKMRQPYKTLFINAP